MKIVLGWLHEFLSVTPSAEEVAEGLIAHGIEVSNIVDQGKGLEDVVIAKIVEFTKHPDADRLSVCKVYDGHETLDIVCGAKNFQAGDHVPLAKVGAKLPGDFEIKKSKIRGVTSHGMLCSEEELGLKEKADGLLILPQTTTLGQSLADYLGKKETVLELELTPNRGDCLSVVGVAQEVSAIFKISAKIPSVGAKGGEVGGLRAAVKDSELCPRYTLHHFDSIEVKPSSTKITSRLEALGIRAISNVVDITNYVMIERGQPQHAFDAEKVVGHLEVRLALAGEKILCLDGIERELTEEDLVIADQSGPIGIAGVMGGQRTAVSDQTKSIYLESAFFSPASIRKTAKRFGLHTESSHRFERFVDPTGCWSASMRAKELLQEFCGARSLGELDIDRNIFKPVKVRLRKNALVRTLGEEVKSAGDYLTRLGFSLEKIESDYFVEVPIRRPDITREIDLIEEVARMHGYQNFGSDIPSLIRENSAELNTTSKIYHLSEFMASLGFHETKSFSFVSSTENQTYNPKGSSTLKILNGFTSDMQEMRTSLLPWLVEAWKLNHSRQATSVKLFEIAKTYDAAPSEQWTLGMLIGGFEVPTWQQPETTYTFFNLKGFLESLSEKYHLKLKFSPMESASNFLHPGQSADVIHQGTKIGFLGASHPKLHKDMGTFFVAELSLHSILDVMFKQVRAGIYSSFPGSKRDLAFIVDEAVLSGHILESIQTLRIPILKTAQVFDVYKGKVIESGKKSLAYQFYFESQDRTLTDAEVNQAIEDITKHVISKFQAQLRA